jgi:hypothetical protein
MISNCAGPITSAVNDSWMRTLMVDDESTIIRSEICIVSVSIFLFSLLYIANVHFDDIIFPIACASTDCDNSVGFCSKTPKKLPNNMNPITLSVLIL